MFIVILTNLLSHRHSHRPFLCQALLVKIENMHKYTVINLNHLSCLFTYIRVLEVYTGTAIAHSEAPPSASGAHYRPLSPCPLVNRTRILKSLYTGRKKYKTHSILAHIYHKSLAELWFTFAERDIRQKSVSTTWKLSKKWPLGSRLVFASVLHCHWAISVPASLGKDALSNTGSDRVTTLSAAGQCHKHTCTWTVTLDYCIALV